MAAQALIFDLDGTIWDSYPRYALAIAGDDARLRNTVEDKLRRGASVISLLRQHGVSERRFLQCVLDEHGPTLLYPGAATAIRELGRRRTPLAIATSLPGRIAEPMLARVGLADHIRVVVHAGNCRSRKPNPGPILSALRLLRVEPSADLYYVGDRADDAEAASRAEVSFAWASYGYEESEPTGCAAVLPNIKAVIHL